MDPPPPPPAPVPLTCCPVPWPPQEECNRYAYLEWISESQGLEYMTLSTFSRAMFLFVDSWCESKTKAGYLAFSREHLLPIVSEERVTKIQAFQLSENKDQQPWRVGSGEKQTIMQVWHWVQVGSCDCWRAAAFWSAPTRRTAAICIVDAVARRYILCPGR